MSEDTKKTRTPKLRFPEFREAGEWVHQTLGDLTYKSDKKNKDGKKLPIYSINNKEGFLPQSDQFEGIDSNNRGYDTTLYKVIEKNTFAYNPARIDVGSIGYSGDLNNIIISSLYVCFKTKESVDDAFLMQFLKTSYFNEAVKNTVEGGIRNYLFYENFSIINISLPQRPEQQKIAATLTTLDELIAAQSEKIKALQAHKKGLMQQMFPAEGETAPRVRFREFEGDGEWEKVALEKITHKIMVGIASAATHAYRKSGVILFRNQNIRDGYLDDKEILFIDKEYEEAHKNKRLKAGDLLIARTGYPGAACVVPKKYEGSQSFTTLIARPNNKFINSDFLCLYVNSELGQAFFESTKIGGGQQNVNAGSLSEMPIPYPSLKEQQKIAATLSSLDELITAQSEKLEALKMHKKGLMQGMFPAPGASDNVY